MSSGIRLQLLFFSFMAIWVEQMMVYRLSPISGVVLLLSQLDGSTVTKLVLLN